MSSLGGSMFIHNAIDSDYCIQEALASLCAACDKVVVMDCRSTDQTLALLFDSAHRNPNLHVIQDADWECAPNYLRLSILANQAKSYLDTDWHFMLQADEVLHEDSFEYIRKAMRGPYDSYAIRRTNFFGDFNHHLGYEISQSDKPCSDIVFRLAHIKYNAFSDAESLEIDPLTHSWEYFDKIEIFHYGFVRDGKKQVDKVHQMHSWFYGPGSVVDSRIVTAKENNESFDWRKFKSKNLLQRFHGTHPVFAEKWVAERQAQKVPVEL